MNAETEMLYDCAIVGGGLAGLALSIQLAKQNKKIILFEKETYPFHKVCGEYIAMESWNFLESIGVPLTEMNLPRIKKLRVSSPNGNIIEHSLNPGGFGISRFTLDKILFDIALKNGVTVKDKTKVDDVQFADNNFTINTFAANYIAKLVCGAFGKRSNLDVKMNRDFIAKSKNDTANYVGIKYHVKANLADDVIELHNFKDGYCGISKVDDNRYCLCYLTSAKNLKDNDSSIERMQQNVLMKNPILKKYFTEFESLYETPLAISQINFSKKAAVENHIIMLGDAAGLITPLCGNGMSMALHASKIASEWCVKFLNNEINRTTLEKEYALQWHTTFNKRLTAGRIIQYFFGNQTVSNIFISSLKPFPKIVNKLVALTHGDSF